MAVRVLICDDLPLIREGLALLLGVDDIVVLGQTGDGVEAVEQARALQPDVVLMDVRMPHLDGVEATRKITADGFAKDPDRPIKVLILTMFHTDDAVYAALRAGASGFMLKDAKPEDLLAAVRAVAAGDAWIAPGVAKRLLKDFAARHDPQRPTPAELAGLTVREREVHVLVAHGLSNAEIARHLSVSEATVKTHLGRVLIKLGLRDRAQAIAVAYHCGLVLPGSSPPPVQH
ncbi:Transcriptional regulatory protein LiaR [Nonomuraea coxensis DSM 45129]|uniref:Transcriptional regulatory protein LiaR n=1 Tax=Nonomuraea coxensis DSM 45129 TaxID=1122611 RepID=A0ABX8TTD5_9ACTN|nr:response regulator transcription factor [Nonomuraea coxensis]QYC38393.1 Transcriptional regulatory protein LiaR [Nonomuraea coxensis DSM 45129]